MQKGAKIDNLQNTFNIKVLETGVSRRSFTGSALSLDWISSNQQLLGESK